MDGRSGKRYLLASSLLLLLTLSVYLAANSLDSFSQAEVPALRLPALRSADSGTLVFQAIMADEVVYIGWSQHAWPMRGLNASLVEVNAPTVESRLVTNSDGLAQWSLPAGNYSLRTLDPRFNLSIPFQVKQGEVTRVSLRVEESLRSAIFYELSGADSSGLVSRGDWVYAAVPAGTRPTAALSTIFIEAVYPGASPASPARNESVAATVAAANTSHGTVWLGLQSQGTLRTSGAYGLYFVRYDASYNVTVVDSPRP